MAKTFPKVLHVTRESVGSGDDWLQVHERGIADVERNGQPVAIYRLVEVGNVVIQKSFSKHVGTLTMFMKPRLPARRKKR